MMLLLALFIVLLAVPANAATYYVSTSGSNSNNGTSLDTAFRTIQKCIDSMTTAPSTCLVADGTYDTTGSQYSDYVGYVTPPAISGSSGSLMTIKSINPLGAKIKVPTTSGSNYGFYIGRNFWVIEDFEIYQDADPNANIGGTGMTIDGSNIVVRGNTIHDIAWDTCSSLNFGQNGIYTVVGTSGHTIERNVFYNIGRRSLGENGCTGSYAGDSGNRGDHGIYIDDTDNMIIRENIFRGPGRWRGFAIQIFTGTAGTSSNIQIYNNTFSKTPVSGEPHITMSARTSGVTITNNISYDDSAGMMRCSGTSHASMVVSFNRSAGPIQDGSCTSYGVTFASNDVSDSSIGMVDPANEDFRLADGGDAINDGTSISGRSCNGTCDVGAFESFTFSSGSIDLNVMDVQLGMSLHTPAQITDATGWSVACSGHASCPGSPTVSSAVLKPGTDSVIRLTISGISGDACSTSQTWTVSYNRSTGNVTDSAKIGTTLNQPLSSFTTQGVTEVCSGSPTTPPSSGLHIKYLLDDGTSGTTPTTADDAQNNSDGTLTNGPSWTTGKTGNGVAFTGATSQYIATGYGSGINPSTQSTSFCVGVLPSAAGLTSTQGVLGAPLGTNQRFYIALDSNGVSATWGLGVQSSPSSSSSPTEFTATASWTRVCAVFNSGTDTATLYVNGVAGTSSAAVKSYTSFTLSGNIELGRIGSIAGGTGSFTLDDFVLYQSTALTAQEVADDYAAWNQESPALTGTFAQKTHKWQYLREDANGSAVDFSSSGTSNGLTITVIPGGAVNLVTQIDCTVANCDPTGSKLYYSRNSGTFTAVPDTPTADGISFYGNVADPDLVSGTATCCLTGSLTANNGSTQFTAAAVPLFDLAQDASFVRRSVLKLASTVAVGDTYCFKEYHQTELPLDAYTPTAGACLTVGSFTAGVGF
jgi:hypothetical protein